MSKATFKNVKDLQLYENLIKLFWMMTAKERKAAVLSETANKPSASSLTLQGPLSM